MPKLVDHPAREVAIAEAAWRVAVRDGLRAVSVRNVAAEAGLAPGSMRRSFPSQAALLSTCLDLVGRRVTERIRTTPSAGSVRATVDAMLRHLLLLDHERRVEMEVFLVIGSAALTDPALRDAYDRASSALAAGCRALVQRLARSGEAAGIDVDLEARRVHALVDGLALHLLREQPDADTTWATDVLAHHLATLTSR